MKYKLVCFDLDGTLVEGIDHPQYWNTLHRHIQGEKKGAAFEEECIARFKAGTLSYKEWLDEDMGDFQRLGATKKDFEDAAKRHRPMNGAEKTIAELHKRGYKLGVISGALKILVDTLFPNYPFEDVFVNEIDFDEKGLIAGWKDTVYDQGSKYKALHAICEREGISISETVFVGNGENDIDILKEAGLGIAFLPESEKVSAAADVVVTEPDVRKILDFL
ncbi:HAD-IB family phosphatase [Candidatus Woesearchaeota archaeon]|nr:HAD-IB family phosphatase [Candidatus Woesearchaeota archaeon]